MDRYLPLAELYSQTSLHEVAYSALPDAPVQPYTEPRRGLREVFAALRNRVRRPTIEMRPARYGTQG